MPEEKRKRGRPPKNKEQVNINESAQQIKMQDEQDVTVNQINSRLNNIFTRMNMAGLSYSSFKTALNRNPVGDGVFASNPFIQNQRIKKTLKEQEEIVITEENENEQLSIEIKDEDIKFVTPFKPDTYYNIESENRLNFFGGVCYVRKQKLLRQLVRFKRRYSVFYFSISSFVNCIFYCNMCKHCNMTSMFH